MFPEVTVNKSKVFKKEEQLKDSHGFLIFIQYMIKQETNIVHLLNDTVNETSMRRHLL